ncbi:hypothetical protein ACVRX8_00930 [Streptococcus macacae]
MANINNKIAKSVVKAYKKQKLLPLMLGKEMKIFRKNWIMMRIFSKPSKKRP